MMLKQLAKKLYRLYRNRPIKNVFKKNYHQKVLISYIPYPFREKFNNRHSNIQETKIIAKCFDELGYNVDIFSQEDPRDIDYSQYDLIFGVGEPLEASFYYTGYKKQPLRIYYGLGNQIILNNKASLERVADFYEKHAIFLLNSARIGNKAWQIQTTLSDAIITLGNHVTVESYKHFFNGPIFNLPVTFIKEYDYKIIVKNKNFQKSSKHFLWIGGAGLLHKGLDLLLEYFVKHQQLHLHICGPIKEETHFENFFKDHLFNRKNIHTYGFVNISSPLFKTILEKCAFVIFPTCAEGQPSSVITVMGNAGLIPILSRQASIDIDPIGGIEIPKLSLDGIREAIEISQDLDTEQLQTISGAVGLYATSNHMPAHFKHKFKNHILDIRNNSKIL